MKHYKQSKDEMDGYIFYVRIFKSAGQVNGSLFQRSDNLIHFYFLGSSLYSAQLNGRGEGTSTASKTTDGPSVSPHGGHTSTTRKGNKRDWSAMRWRDDLDKYWSDTIWQRTAQDRLTWRRHAEAFTQTRETTAAQSQ